jgi:hypothetical protein
VDCSDIDGDSNLSKVYGGTSDTLLAMQGYPIISPVLNFFASGMAG